MDLDEIRKLFSEAAESQLKSSKLYTLLQNETGKIPILLAYRAGAEALQAKHSWNVLTKWTKIAQAMDLFKKAVDFSPNDIEIRFLRYSIQNNTPTILGYSENLTEDKQKMIDLFAQSNVPNAMKEEIRKIIGQ
ncbi:MAG: hypothetical protein EAZ20_02050 [Bacteroidetes bacterium]|nr:MAG: hypothetical protein EAZ20_02050 [Bacteroidota bacterium]